MNSLASAVLRTRSAHLHQCARAFSLSPNLHDNDSYRFVVLGGGTGGLAMASHLSRKFPNQVAVVEPADNHYYQPMWTLVGAGLKKFEQSVRPMSSVIPSDSRWIKEAVCELRPEENSVVTDTGKKVKYDVLIVAMGLKLDFNKLPGLTEALGTKGVGCNYSANTVRDTFRELQSFKGGNAFFTVPATPVKCLGAPQKIMYLAEEIFRQNGVREKANVVFKTPGGVLFAVEKYKQSLLEVCRQRNIQVDVFRHLINIDPVKQEATFEHVDDENTPKKSEVLKYDFIHITPPMGPVDVLRSSSIVDSNGFVDVNKETLQHVAHSNIFAIGDCTNLPISKTAAAVAAQSDVLRKNLKKYLNGENMQAKYTGYTSCPLVTSHNTCILAEFDYSGKPRETFPIDQSKERHTMFYMKAMVMPELYWNFLIRGRWGGPEVMRKITHLGMVE